MFLLRKPNEKKVRAFLADQAGRPFTYPHVGETSRRTPRGYWVDHYRVCLGRGQTTFQRACAALCRWTMFPKNVAEISLPDTPIERDQTVAVLVRSLGIWNLMACRIVYVVDETCPRSGTRRFGFAYGTLPDHLERGEERFLVEWSSQDDSVWYDLFVASRPRHTLAWIGFPVVRVMQRRFARRSQQSMLQAVAAEPH